MDSELRRPQARREVRGSEAAFSLGDTHQELPGNQISTMLPPQLHGCIVAYPQFRLAVLAADPGRIKGTQEGTGLTSRLPTIRGLSSWINTAPLARICSFVWQGASAAVVKTPTRFEVGTNTDVVQVSGGVLHLESVP
jgi:hypothetical protein